MAPLLHTLLALVAAFCLAGAPPFFVELPMARANFISAAEATLNVALNAMGAPPLPSDAFPTNSSIPSYESWITASNGVRLHATVWQPSTGPAGLPLVVAIASWGFSEAVYFTRIGYLVERGFVVVGYAAQGFGKSGGVWGIADDQDIQDVSTVIDWAVANVGADGSRLGTMGMSYGAGLGVLAACRDSRIRSLVSLSGWGDMASAFYDRRTPMVQTLETLRDVGTMLGRAPDYIDSGLRQLSDHNETFVDEFMLPRSPAKYIDQLNKNNPSIFFASGWRDSIFSPNQNVEFFERFTGPKHYDMRYGDHVVAEAYGLIGFMTEFWSLGIDWLDAHLNGNTSSGILDLPTVRVRPSMSAELEGAPSFEQLAAAEIPYTLGNLSNDKYSFWNAFDKSVGDLTGTYQSVEATSLFSSNDTLAEWSNLAPLPAPTAGGANFSYSFSTDKTTGATAGIPLISNLLMTDLNIPTAVDLDQLDRRYGAMWTSEVYPDGLSIRGAAIVSINVESTAELGTLVAFLYDLDPSTGKAVYIQSAPYSFPIEGPRTGDGQPFARTRVTFDIFLALYDLGRGHQVMLVIQGSDERLTAQNPEGSVITLSGDEEHPATLILPVK